MIFTENDKRIIFNALDNYAHGNIAWDEGTFNDILQLMSIFAQTGNEYRHSPQGYLSLLRTI